MVLRKNTEEKIARVRMMDYMVHFNLSENTIYFSAYPVVEYDNFTVVYVDKENEMDRREFFDEDKCLKKFEGSFCDRGVWESRIYFTDDEYWGYELAAMHELYNNHISLWCVEALKQPND